MWYANLLKPDWAPPAWLFGPVWGVLYVLIAISYVGLAIGIQKKKIPSSVLWPFAINLVTNLAFSPIQFQLQNNYLALVDILIVLITIIWSMVAVYPYKKWIAYLQIPYLLWVSFATVLQISITYLNA